MYTHQQQRQRLDARCQIYSRIKNKGFPPPDEKEKVKSNPLGSKNIKAAQISQERESKKHHTLKKSRRIWESWKPPVTFWKLDNHTNYTIVSNCQKPTILSCFEFPKSFHFENLPRNYLKKPKSPFTRKIFAVYPNCLSAQPREKHLRCGALGSKKSKMKEGYYQIKLTHSVFNGESISKRS